MGKLLANWGLESLVEDKQTNMAERGFLFGYDDQPKWCRVYSSNRRKVLISRGVKFPERNHF